MSVDTLTNRDLYRLTLATPATVEPLSGEIALTSANLIGGASPSFTNLAATGTLTVGETSTLTGAVTMGGALTVTTNLTATGGTTACRTLTVSQTSTLTGAVTITNLLTANGGITVGPGGTTSVGSDLFAVGNNLSISNLTNVVSMVLPVYADNAAALLGGLVANNLYRTVTGEPRIVV